VTKVSDAQRTITKTTKNIWSQNRGRKKREEDKREEGLLYMFVNESDIHSRSLEIVHPWGRKSIGPRLNMDFLSSMTTVFTP
jgi:hypothetical protein